ncbi:MAG: hypothetical protein AB1489_35275, partial [Acidobacteriota bacterium]
MVKSKLLSFIIAILLVVVGGVSAVSAQSFYMNRQLARIQQGIRSGALTRREAVRLQSRVINLHNYERSARADGYLDWRERRYIDQERRRIDQAIFSQKHDRQG